MKSQRRRLPDMQGHGTDITGENGMINWLDIDDLERTIRDFDYTRIASRNIERIITSDSFAEMDSDRIYEYLLREMEIVSFRDYLKRYIYEKAQFMIPFREVTEEDFCQIMEDNFLQNHAPHSFSKTTKRLRQTIRGWLNQESAKRSTIFLLGFGLRMSEQDVSEFLTKVIKEEDFDFWNPEEVVYWYCFHKGLHYADARRLLDDYAAAGPTASPSLGSPASAGPTADPSLDGPAAGPESAAQWDPNPAAGPESAAQQDPGSGPGTPDPAGSLPDLTWNDFILREDFDRNSESYLKQYLHMLQHSGRGSGRNEDAYREFLKLYDRARDTIIRIYQQDPVELKLRRTLTREEIGPSDIEKILLSGVPHTASGNLTKSSSGLLSRQFQDKRPERHRIDNILKRKILVDRFDLITLLFLVYAEEVEPDWPAERFIQYIDEMNGILRQSHMLELYPANPYEAFIAMCLVSDSPLTVYADIWEMSYETEEMP